MAGQTGRRHSHKERHAHLYAAAPPSALPWSPLQAGLRARELDFSQKQRLPVRGHSGMSCSLTRLPLRGQRRPYLQLQYRAHRLPVSSLGRMPLGHLKHSWGNANCAVEAMSTFFLTATQEVLPSPAELWRNSCSRARVTATAGTPIALIGLPHRVGPRPGAAAPAGRPEERAHAVLPP